MLRTASSLAVVFPVVWALVPARPVIPPLWTVIPARRTIILARRRAIGALRLGRGRAAGGRGACLCLLGLILGYEACFQEFVAQVLHDCPAFYPLHSRAQGVLAASVCAT